MVSNNFFANLPRHRDLVNTSPETSRVFLAFQQEVSHYKPKVSLHLYIFQSHCMLILNDSIPQVATSNQSYEHVHTYSSQLPCLHIWCSCKAYSHTHEEGLYIMWTLLFQLPSVHISPINGCFLHKNKPRIHVQRWIKLMSFNVTTGLANIINCHTWCSTSVLIVSALHQRSKA